MGEPDTFGNNEAKKPQKSLAQLLSITTSGPDQFIMLRKLGFCHYYVRNDENRENDRRMGPVRALQHFQPDVQGRRRAAAGLQGCMAAGLQAHVCTQPSAPARLILCESRCRLWAEGLKNGAVRTEAPRPLLTHPPHPPHPQPPPPPPSPPAAVSNFRVASWAPPASVWTSALDIMSPTAAKNTN